MEKIFKLYFRCIQELRKWQNPSHYERIEAIPNIVITGPVGYLDFVALMASSTLALTDSGGLQEETTALGIPYASPRKILNGQLQ